MQRFQTITNWAAAITQLSHIFCCGLPAAFSLLSLLSSFGIMASLPFNIEELHHVMHDYEMALLTMAGMITAMGWMLHFISWRIDCRSTGCQHAPCAPKKRRSSRVLVLSSVLFIINIVVLMTAHG